MKEVWLPGLSLQRFWQFYSFVLSIFNDQFEKLYQTLTGESHQVSKHLEVAPHFSTHFLMCGHPDETLFLVFDILLKKSNHYQVVLSKNEVSLL